LHRCRGGFTLAEVLICSVIVLIGFMALVAAFGQESVSIQRGEDATLATFLADEIRDMALQMPFADVLALNGQTFSPTLVLSTGQTEHWANWSQVITVTQVSVGPATAARLIVDVRAGVPPNNRSVVRLTYYIFDRSAVK
jgi:prepilin-type N-terminal cleavage/methylation domain-containing protein